MYCISTLREEPRPISQWFGKSAGNHTMNPQFIPMATHLTHIIINMSLIWNHFPEILCTFARMSLYWYSISIPCETPSLIFQGFDESANHFSTIPLYISTYAGDGLLRNTVSHFWLFGWIIYQDSICQWITRSYVSIPAYHIPAFMYDNKSAWRQVISLINVIIVISFPTHTGFHL